MQTVIVELGGKEYVVEELPRKKNVQWRQRLEKELSPLLGLIEQSQEIELDNLPAITNILGNAKQLIMQSPDVVLSLLLAYSPDLKNDSKRIENESYESEIVESFVSILRLAFPFFSVGSGLTALTNSGSAQPPNGRTSKRRVLPSGESGQMK